jgi:TetR/AcrR family transcriptional regulator, transcriptional repressor for nem operon
MTIKMKARELAKQETREALVRAGMAVFTEEGVDLPSLDAICARAGFTRGAFYVHFKDREDFFAAVADHALKDFIHGFVPGGNASPQGGLKGVIDRFFSVLAEGKKLSYPHKLLMQIAARGVQRGSEGHDPYRLLIRGAIERMTQVVREGQTHGVIKRDLEPEQLGLLLVASAVGFVVLFGGGLDRSLEELRVLCARWLFSSAAKPQRT